MLMTKEQIAQQRKHMQEQLRLLEEQEKNFEKKEEGFIKLAELEDKYTKDRAAMAKKYFISEAELQNLTAPKAVFAIPYKDSLGNPKMYEWFKGKIGKAPREIEIAKSHGLESLMQYLTDFGRTYMETEDGNTAVKMWITPKPAKVAKIHNQAPATV